MDIGSGACSDFKKLRHVGSRGFPIGRGYLPRYTLWDYFTAQRRTNLPGRNCSLSRRVINFSVLYGRHGSNFFKAAIKLNSAEKRPLVQVRPSRPIISHRRSLFRLIYVKILQGKLQRKTVAAYGREASHVKRSKAASIRDSCLSHKIQVPPLEILTS